MRTLPDHRIPLADVTAMLGGVSHECQKVALFAGTLDDANLMPRTREVAGDWQQQSGLLPLQDG